MSNANSTAFPHFNQNGELIHELAGGLTKREYFAGLAMQAIVQEHKAASRIAHQEPDVGTASKAAAEMAVECADALLTQLEKAIQVRP